VEMKADPRKAIVVPREAVISTNQQNYLYVVEDDKAKQVKVEVGESDGKRMEILSGLNGGEQVVVKGQNTLSPGSPVAIFDQNKPAKND
ncbi:hypothetical protein MXD81_21840, partial [Microbacteriaceae bacterium K1510]|nr:hypothetical protein [Microbacteriaceae bacterium K1510]